MKILVRKEYKNANYGANIVDTKGVSFPFDIAPDMVCENLTSFLNKNEVRYLGKSVRHHFPSDVIVCECDAETEFKINAAYELPIQRVALLNGDIEKIEEFSNDLLEHECLIRDEYAGKIADDRIAKVLFEHNSSMFYKYVDTDKSKAKIYLEKMKKENFTSEIARAESYLEIF